MSVTVSRGPSPSTYQSPLKKSITIETRTSSKTLNIEWVINKETLDIAKLSPQKNKKGVIATSMQYGAHTLNFELCLTGWKRSHRDHSAFYFTVPQETRRSGSTSFDEEEFKSPPLEFVAKYSISFQRGSTTITRNSSIREDFDLGVGFPNFTEQSSLLQAVRDNKLVLKIRIETFERKSRICQYPESQHRPQSAISQLMTKMYYEKLNADAVILVKPQNVNGINALNSIMSLHGNKCYYKRIEVHRCVLAAVSPVFCSFFKHQSREKETSSIVMDQWNEDIVTAMVRYLYLGHIEFDEHSKIDAIRHRQREESHESESLSADESDEEEEHSETVGLDELTKEESLELMLEEVKQDESGEEEKEENIDGNGDGGDGTECRQKMGDDTLKKKKKKKESTKLTEIQNEGLQQLTAECPERVRKLFGLLQMAECYEIEELLVSCCCELRESISLQSCVLLLLHLSKYQHIEEMKQIKEYILDYTVTNIKDVRNTNGYQYILKNKPKLVDVIIEKLAHTEETRVIV